MKTQSLKRVCSGVHAYGLGNYEGAPTVDEVRQLVVRKQNVVFIVGSDQTTTRNVIRAAARRSKGQPRLKLTTANWNRGTKLFHLHRVG